MPTQQKDFQLKKGCILRNEHLNQTFEILDIDKKGVITFHYIEGDYIFKDISVNKNLKLKK